MTARARVLLLVTVVASVLGLGMGPAVAAPGDGRTVKVYVVKSPENNGGQVDALPSIARRTLGDPGRAAEIFTLNRGVPQADGGTLTSAADLHPGWILQLPDDAKGPDVQLGRINGTGQQGDAAQAGYFTWKLIAALVGVVLLAAATLLVIFRRRVARSVGAVVGRLTGPIRRSRHLKRQQRLRRQLRDSFAADQVSQDIVRRAVGELTARSTGRAEVYAVATGPQGVTAWLAATGEPPAPWREVSPGQWARPHPIDFGVGVPSQSRLVRVGATSDGAQLFIDFSWLDGMLAVDGDREVAMATLDALGGAAAAAGIRIVDRPPAIGGARQAPAGGTVLAAARQRTVTEMLVHRGELPAAELNNLIELTANEAGGFAAAVLGMVPAAHWQWTAATGGLVQVPALGLSVIVPA